MTETQLDSADVVAGQLGDILVSVDPSALRRLDRKTLFAVLDWVDVVKEATARMLRVGPAPVAIRRWLRPEQLAGEWTAFTDWRPAVKQKQQVGLF